MRQNKILRNVLYAIACILLVLQMIPAVAKAATDATNTSISIHAGEVSAECVTGNTVKVPVYTDSNTGYLFGQIRVQWDRDALKLKDIAFNKTTDCGSAPISGDESSYTVCFGQLNGTSDNVSTGVLFTLEFTVDRGAQQKSYDILLMPSENNFVNYNLGRVIATETDGKVTLGKPVTPLAGTLYITGEAKYGSTLTAVASLTNGNPDNLRYTWMNKATGAILSTDGNTYVPKESDIGTTIECIVSDMGREYSGNLSVTVNIYKADGPNKPSLTAVKCSNKGAADGKITGTNTTMEWSTTPTFTTATSCNGSSITGLKAGEYYVRYKETATTNHGLAAIVTVPDGDQLVLEGTVTLSGDAKYGSTITASVSLTSGNTANLTYSWNNSKTGTIPSQTSSTYKLQASDIGCVVTCYVSDKTGTYISNLSKSTATVTKADGPAKPTGITYQKPSRKGMADGRLKGVTSAMEFSAQSSFAEVKVGTGAEIYGLKAGTYYVRYKETPTTKAGEAAAITIPDGPEIAITGTVTITGIEQYNQILAAKVTGSQTTNYAYQWKRGNNNIKGATSSTYRLVKADIGQKITCVVTDKSGAYTNSISGTSGVIAKQDATDVPSGFEISEPSVKGASDGEIIGTTTQMEYATNAQFTGAKTCTGDRVTGLKAGTYYFRYAETDVKKASTAHRVIVPDGKPAPTTAPTAKPTTKPSATPKATTKPTTAPTTKPTTKPSATPKATTKPTTAPTTKPTTKPTATPKATTKPTTKPTATPKATTKPTTKPTATPKATTKPTTKPTATPKATTKPTTKPTATPKATAKPTTAPTAKPTAKPTVKPTATPKATTKPTTKPSASPAASTKPVTEVFTDVKPSAWFVKAVQYVYDQGIMSGKGSEFQPGVPVTREEFAQTLYNHMNKPDVNTAADNNPFPDVKAKGWYFKAVIWAKDNDIVKGYANGKFGVGDKITREQLAQMLYKYAKLREYDMTLTEGASTGYSDSNKRSDWAYTALDWAVSQGIISGKGTTGAPKSEMKLDPKGNATRAECAQMVMKLLQKNAQ